MENTIKHDFDDLYRGVAQDFDEKQYLTELSKVRYEIKSILKKYDLLLNNDGLGADDSCIGHSDERIDKNGAMVIEFSAGIPYNIVTPYGSFPVRSAFRKHNYNQDEKCNQELFDLFGLTSTAGNSDMMAITKLPWQEKAKEVEKQEIEQKEQTETNEIKPVKQSFFSRIFPWRRKATVVESENVAQSEDVANVVESENTAQPENVAKSEEMSKVSTGLNLQAPANFYSLKVKGDYNDEVATMIFREEKHINQLLAEINTEFIQNGHPEYMLPGDKTKYTVDGKDYMVNKINRVYTERNNEVEKAESTEKQTANIQADLGMEM